MRYELTFLVFNIDLYSQLTQDLLSVMERPPVHNYVITPVEHVNIYSCTDIEERRQIKEEEIEYKESEYEGFQEADIQEDSQEEVVGEILFRSFFCQQQIAWRCEENSTGLKKASNLL